MAEMTGLPEGLNVRAWYRGVFFAGTALLLGGGASGDRLIALLGLGMLLVGWGEWLNHPFLGVIIPGYSKVGEARKNNIAGVSLAVCGAVLAGMVAARMIAAELPPWPTLDLKHREGRDVDISVVLKPGDAATTATAGRPGRGKAEEASTPGAGAAQQPAGH